MKPLPTILALCLAVFASFAIAAPAAAARRPNILFIIVDDQSPLDLQVYNPAMLPDDFAARSPHSILVTTFGRMGIVGVLVFLGVMAVTGVTTVRAIRAVDVTSTEIALWASAWLILISACFGVVLEGPMGAVVFWTLLGMANGGWREPVREMEERARTPNPGRLRTSDPTTSNAALSGVSELGRTSS